MGDEGHCVFVMPHNLDITAALWPDPKRSRYFFAGSNNERASPIRRRRRT
jgi:hypothetical protein